MNVTNIIVRPNKSYSSTGKGVWIHSINIIPKTSQIRQFPQGGLAMLNQRPVFELMINKQSWRKVLQSVLDFEKKKSNKGITTDWSYLSLFYGIYIYTWIIFIQVLCKIESVRNLQKISIYVCGGSRGKAVFKC